ncbi:hypothetical protein HBH70_028570 [Parastagonospora nodorum]|nr:hypothetical protein HBH70_028570 [Parastagonospora nodorum]KAH5211735.1 hypothetical protein HBI62_199180 [Parastagonospora nodorum]KAH5731890.1 hypothetical protein HBI20_039840 [Parastagonospora nodorum]KAH6142820.1 hypothetical protein HBI63_189210 [Parastagonospora nodorum]KAH6170556.1 hypothetical protein HBI61_188160 [Parastagonospora nodorum]
MAAWLSSFLSRTNPPPPQVNSTEPFNDSRANQDRLSSTMARQPGPELTQHLLPNMPSLFTLALPPCGLEIQLAYQNIVHSLRRRWLRAAADDPATKPTALDIALSLKSDLDDEAVIHPPGSLAHTKTRRPWRRENVFNFEIRWAAYFVREAEVEKGWGKTDAEERRKVEYSQLMDLIPQELGVAVRRRGNVEDVYALWREWHAGKRRDLDVVKKKEELWEDEGEMVTLSELVGRKFFEKDLAEAKKKMEEKMERERETLEKLKRETDKTDKNMRLEKKKDAGDEKKGLEEKRGV